MGLSWALFRAAVDGQVGSCQDGPMLHGKATRFLRSLGHELSPTVQIGKEGVTEGVVKATAQALLDHELIKVKVGREAPEERVESLSALAEAASAELVQVLGRTGLLYKRHPQKPRIQLPRPTSKPAPSP